MKEYSGLRIITWVLRAFGILTVIGGISTFAIAAAEGKHVELAFITAAAVVAGGIVLYAIGDALAALADIAQNTERTANATQSASAMLANQIAQAQHAQQPR